MAKRPCARPGCAALVDRGYCVEHAVNGPATLNERRRGSSAERGYGYRWQQARQRFLRHHPLCVDPDGVHRGRFEAATDVDHIVPHRGDPVLFWLESNWQPLCASCHSRKTAKEDGGFGAARVG
jgi:5-methylcytosine-specific restriction enzyme A